ncbi:MAG: PEGA domain-containing protein [candidate division NC10 bacterium]|nr:PEGA domain-containing protein [candidate division NC10 bacterium]MDE2321162.1 PEGA domain-containing protein [candidate division NC10 bacterium]
MIKTTRVHTLGVIAALILTSLIVIPVGPALARTHFSFGLNLGVPLGPYPGYWYPYPYPYAIPYPPPGYYPPAPAYPAPYPAPYEAPPDYPPPTAPPSFSPDASLQIEVTPEETEIVIDGIKVGLAKEFHGPATVPVAAGPHVVELYWGGFSTTEIIVASPQTTVVIKRGLGPAAPVAPSPQPPSPGAKPQSPH